MSTLSKIINFTLFQACWFACVVGAAYGQALIGPIVVGFAVAVQLYWDKSRFDKLKFILAVAILGTSIDAIVVNLGIYNPTVGSMSVFGYPLWLIALWPAFATTIYSSMSWLSNRYLLAAGFGLIGGPLSYYSGMKFGALSLSSSPWMSLSLLGLVWAVVTPAIFYLCFIQLDKGERVNVYQDN